MQFCEDQHVKLHNQKHKKEKGPEKRNGYIFHIISNNIIKSNKRVLITVTALYIEISYNSVSTFKSILFVLLQRHKQKGPDI